MFETPFGVHLLTDINYIFGKLLEPYGHLRDFIEPWNISSIGLAAQSMTVSKMFKSEYIGK
jgi:hypothetical protein